MKFPGFTFNSPRHATLALCMMFVLLATLSAQKQTHITNSIKKPIAISDCATIDTPGSYILTNNLGCPNGGNQQTSGIIITASNVTVHLAGYSISAAADGIHGDDVTKVAIVGPGTVSALGAGIHLTNVNKSQLIGVTCSDAIVCIRVSGVGNRIVANKLSFYEEGISGDGQGNLYLGNECSGGIVAIVISGQGDLIEGNTCGGSRTWGFDITGTAETIVGNQADGNGKVGISVAGTHNQIRNNEATNNTMFDLEDGNGVCGENSWKLNAFTTANLPCIN